MARTFPPEAYQLAASYNLGAPVKRYTNSPLCITYFIVVSILSGIPILLGLFGLVASSLVTLLAPYSSMDFSFLMGFFVIGVLLSPLSIFLLVLALFERRTYVYQCIEGFIVTRKGANKVEHLRWDDVLKTRVMGGRYGTSYLITGVHGESISIPYRGIWKECKKAVARRTAQGQVSTQAAPGANIRVSAEQLLTGLAEARKIGEQCLTLLERDEEVERLVEQLLTILEQNEEARRLVEQSLVVLAETRRLGEQLQEVPSLDGKTKHFIGQLLTVLAETGKLGEHFLIVPEQDRKAKRLIKQVLAVLEEAEKVVQRFPDVLEEAEKVVQQFLLHPQLDAETRRLGEQFQVLRTEASKLSTRFQAFWTSFERVEEVRELANQLQASLERSEEVRKLSTQIQASLAQTQRPGSQANS